VGGHVVPVSIPIIMCVDVLWTASCQPLQLSLN